MCKPILLFAVLAGWVMAGEPTSAQPPPTGQDTQSWTGNPALEAGKVQAGDPDQTGGWDSVVLVSPPSDLERGQRTHGPDLTVADLLSLKRWGRYQDITAYSVGTTVCNIGDAPVDWQVNNNRHPIVPQHMYRYKNGRFEQIGMSWVAHTFYALNQTYCYTDCQPNGGASLGIHCSDTHSAVVNGLQANLGPRWQVNAATGYFPYPWDSPAYQITVGRRLQVHDADLHPPDNPGAIYFVEVHYITADEAATQNDDNNVAYRRIQIVWDQQNPTVYNIAFVPGQETRREKAALWAWQELDPGVAIADGNIPAEGHLYLAYRATSLGGGMYHYEYALYNMNSDRSAQSFSVPVPVGVTVSNVGFHDVDYHSFEPYSLTDWTYTVAGGSVTWSTTLYAVNPNANALRWGTTYNFRFDADVPPNIADATVALFKPGTPTMMTLPTLGPVPLTGADCNSNGTDDALDIFAGTSRDCNRTGIPDECDVAAGTSEDCSANGTPDECEPDCNDNNIPDVCDLLAGTSLDCNSNGLPDTCDVDAGTSLDCNLNTRPDECDLAGGTSRDCNGDQVPDSCNLAGGGHRDCNSNGILDVCDVSAGTSVDCNSNSVPDTCDIAVGTALDCNLNLTPDVCDVSSGASLDCNHNTTPDECESPADCNGNGRPDICDLYAGTSRDCNANTVPDECDIEFGTSRDCNTNVTPDECERDCNANTTPDDCDIAQGTSRDCDTNGIPDECSLAAGTSHDCNVNQTLDECDLATGVSEDCNDNTTPDECDLSYGTSKDCNQNDIPDSCDIAAGTSRDCNGNGFPDSCDLAAGSSLDCNTNGRPDSCDVSGGTSPDCNSNVVPDECESNADCNQNLRADICDLTAGTSRDCNQNARPDECDIAGGTSRDCNTNGTADECEPDCNANDIPDDCDITAGTLHDLDQNGEPDECDTNIPAVSEWGLIVLTLALLAGGAVVIRRRQAGEAT